MKVLMSAGDFLVRWQLDDSHMKQRDQPATSANEESTGSPVTGAEWSSRSALPGGGLLENSLS